MLYVKWAAIFLGPSRLQVGAGPKNLIGGMQLAVPAVGVAFLVNAGFLK
ncbi:MAG: hypothetical protein GX334_07140 [Firmicutes bacterium]|nr:hypothetical protein [Bacillota bacterium]